MRANSKNQQKNSIETRKKSIRLLMSTTAFVAGVLLVPSYAQADPANSWDYDVVLDGNVGKDTSVAGITDITVTGGNGFVEGNADIYTGHTVNVTGDNGATFAYRDNRANIESTLNGNLNSNMKIVVIDRDGIFFGNDFNADVQSIIATTGHVEVSDIMDGGQLTISDVDQGGDITQNGTITIAEAGLAAFVAPTVKNNGVINAKLARVQIGAVKTATVDLYGDGLLEIALDAQLSDALIENSGGIFAEGGVVQMTAMAVKGTVDKIVNNKGIISVSSVTQKGGKIILSGGAQGTVAISGALDASGTSGGEVEIIGERILTLVGADIDASGTVDNGGTITLETDNIYSPITTKFIQAKGADGTIQINRLTQGRVSLGKKSGGLRVSQNTINEMEAENLIIGNVNSSENKVTEINVRSIDTTASISGLVQLNALSNVVNDESKQNDGDVEFDRGTNRFNSLEANAIDDINFRKNVDVETLVGDMVFNADVDANDATGDTNRVEFLGDNATLLSAGDITFTGQDYVDVYEGTSITANSIKIDRSKVGRILLGGVVTEDTLLNEMQIDQGELGNFNAQQLIVGYSSSSKNKVSEINVNGFDTTSAISGLVQLNSLSTIVGGGHKNEGDVEFDAGTNSFNSLEVNALDDVIFRTDVVVETKTGDMVFNADADSNASSGDTNIIEFLGGGGATVESAGDITFSGKDYVDVHNDTVVRANVGTGTVNFQLSSDGVIGLGAASGDMQIDQIELDNIYAGTLNVGHPLAVNSNTTDVNVHNADISHINNVNLYALAASTVNFSGTNNFVNLNAIASSTTGVINVLDGFVNATNSIHFNAPLVNLNGDLNAPVITGTASTVFVQSDDAQIQDGIDVAKYIGATVNVAAGTYAEDVNVYKEVKLYGANSGVEGYNSRGLESRVTPSLTGFYITADNVVLDGFKIENGVTGVLVDNADNATIINNYITGSSRNAVYANNADYLAVLRNKITYAGRDGIHIEGGDYANILRNRISYVGDDGIDVHSNDYVDIKRNDIRNTGERRSDGNGVEVSGSNFAEINRNLILDSGDDGVDVEGGDFVEVNYNIIRRAGDDGVDLSGGEYANIIGNRIYDTADDGVDVDYNRYVDVKYNKIYSTGLNDNDGNGIEVAYSDYADIKGNRIDDAGDDGVDVEGGAYVDVRQNIITDAGDDGVDVEYSYQVDVIDNNISGASNDGIEVIDSAEADVTGNNISNVGGDGIYALNTDGIDIIDNVIEDAGVDGIYVDSDFDGFSSPFFALRSASIVPMVSSVNIVGNTVSNAGYDGIHAVNISDLLVLDNNVSDSFAHGFYASGAYNGNIMFQGNTFTDNGNDSGSAAARFESGDIDMSDVDAPNIFINTSGLPAVAMQFEEVPSVIFPSPIFLTDQPGLVALDEGFPEFGNGLRIVNETLGSTVFDGYTPDGSFYVKFEDGAILDEVTGDPIIIDGTNASFDTIIPASLGNILSTENLEFIEDRLYDADDLDFDGRGQIFVGDEEVSSASITNFEDFSLRDPSRGEGEKGGASLEIRGLPPVSLVSLNDIEPASGNESNQGNAEDVANISPEAGGDDEQGSTDVTCIGDVVNSISNGSVTYSFGGTSEESIVATSSCATSTGT